MGITMKSHINLLSQSFRRRQLLFRRLKQWLIVGLCAVACGSLIGWSKWRNLQAQKVKLDFLTHENDPFKKMQSEIGAIKTQINELQQREAIVLELADEQSMLSLMGIVSQAAEVCEGSVTIRKLHVERNQGIRSGKAGTFRILTLEGVGSDNISVARFARALRESNAFDDVQLRSSALRLNQQQDDPDQRSYTLECVF